MSATDIVAYSLMLGASVVCGLLIDGVFGFPRWITIATAVISGPASVILLLVVISRFLDKRN
jgi:hypothetical protein